LWIMFVKLNGVRYLRVIPKAGRSISLRTFSPESGSACAQFHQKAIESQKKASNFSPDSNLDSRSSFFLLRVRKLEFPDAFRHKPNQKRRRCSASAGLTWRCEASVVITVGNHSHHYAEGPHPVAQWRADGLLCDCDHTVTQRTLGDSLMRSCSQMPAASKVEPCSWLILTRADRRNNNACDAHRWLRFQQDRGLIANQPSSASLLPRQWPFSAEDNANE
jgi:hypothetical protein